MKKLSLVSLVLASFIMVGCDSSSDSEGGSSSAKAVTPLTCNESFQSMKIASGTDGDIAYSCKIDESFGYSLANGVNALNVVEVEIEEIVNVTCNDGSGNYEAKTSLASKTVNYKGNSTALGDIECKETYTDNRVPAVLSTASSIDALLSWEQATSKNDSRLASTTCPDSFYDDSSDGEDGDNSCSGTFLTNFTVTDDSGKKHLIAISNEF